MTNPANRKKYILSIFALLAFIIGGFWFITRRDNVPEGKIRLEIQNGDGLGQVQLDIFNRMETKLHAEIRPGTDNIMEILVQNAGGHAADIIGNISEDNIMTFSDVGLLADLTPHTVGTLMSPDAFHPSVRDGITVNIPDPDGKMRRRQIAVPANVQHSFIIYNRALFEKKNIPPPHVDLTWEEYIEKAAALTESSIPGRMPEIIGAVGVDPTIIIWESGGYFFNSNGTRCTLDSPQVIDAMTFYHRLIHRDRAEPVRSQSKSDDQDFRLKAFADGQIAMLWVSRRALPFLRREISRRQQGNEVPLSIGACLLPRFATGNRYVNMKIEGVGINRSSKHHREALSFLNFLTSPPYYASFVESPCGKPASMDFNRDEFLSDRRCPDDPAINMVAVKCWEYGRLRRRCPFIPYNQVEREFHQARIKIAMSPNLTRDEIAVLMQSVTLKINQAIQKAIERDKTLQRLYNTLNSAQQSSD